MTLPNKSSLLAACVYVILFAQASAISFEKGIDLSQTVLFNDVHWIDADGNGVEDAVGIDANHHILIARLRANRGQAPLQKRLLGGPSGREDFHFIQKCDLDQDGKTDLFTFLDGKIHWWQGGSTGLSYAGVWRTINQNIRTISSIIDIDNDGQLDLVIPEHPFDFQTYYQPYFPPTIAFGKLQGDFAWHKYESLRDTDARPFDWGQPLDIDGDEQPDLSDSYGRVTRFKNRQISEIVETQGLTAMHVPQFTQQVYLRTNQSASGETTYSIHRYSPGGNWLDVGSETTSDKIQTGYLATMKITSIHPGAFDLERRGSLLFVLEPDAALTSYHYQIWVIVGFDGNGLTQLQVSPPAWENALIKPGHAVAKNMSELEPDGLLRYSYPVEATDIFGNSTAQGHAIHDFIRMMPTQIPTPGSFAISDYHEPVQLVSNPDQSARGWKLASLGNRDGRLLIWRDFDNQTPPLTAFRVKDGFSLTSGGNRSTNFTDLIFSSSPSQTERFFFPEAGQQTMRAGGGWMEETSAGLHEYREIASNGSHFPQHLIGVSDIDGDGFEDILHIDPVNGALIRRRAYVPPVTHLQSASFGDTHWIAGAVVPFSVNEPAAQTSMHTLLFDMDDDGDDDIIRFPSLLGNRIAVHWNDAGVFDRHTAIGPAFGTRPQGILHASFLGTQKSFAIWEYDQTTFSHILRILDAGGRTVNSLELGHGISHLKTGDFDGDGDADIVVTGRSAVDIYGNFISSDFSINVFKNSGGGAFEAPLHLQEFTWDILSILTNDINTDGLDDIVAGSMSGQVIRYLSLAEPAPLSYAQWAAHHGASPDGSGNMDRDDLPDLIEYVTGSNPRVSNDIGPHRKAARLDFKIYWRPNDNNPEEGSIGSVYGQASLPIRSDIPDQRVAVAIETSRNLIDWETMDHSISPAIRRILHGHPGWDILEFQPIGVSTSLNRGTFYRFKASLEPK